jgi:hypothetical protein
VFTVHRPTNCTELETAHFVQQVYFGLNTENSIAICRLASPALAADSVRVTRLEVKANKATAEVAVEGAVYDGQVLAVGLIKEGGQWKLDSIDRFIGFDADHFAAAFAKTHHEAGDLGQEQVGCVAKSLESVPANELKAAMLAGEPHRLSAKFRRCLK